jgi:hypothetical protein
MKKVYYIGDWARKGVTVDWSRWTRQAKAEAVTGRAAYLVGWTSFSMPAISSGSCACTRARSLARNHASVSPHY